MIETRCHSLPAEHTGGVHSVCRAASGAPHMERHGGCVLRFMVCGPDAVHVCAVAHNEVNQEEDLDALVLVRATSAVWARGDIVLWLL